MCLTKCSQSLQLVLIVSVVWSANLENLVLAIDTGLAQQCPVSTCICKTSDYLQDSVLHPLSLLMTENVVFKCSHTLMRETDVVLK